MFWDRPEYKAYEPQTFKETVTTVTYTPQFKELTDEEINQCWAESHEDGIAIQQGFTTQQHYFANLILRKAREK